LSREDVQPERNRRSRSTSGWKRASSTTVFAARGLDKSLLSLGDTSLRLRTFVPAAVVIEEDPIIAAQKRLRELSTQIAQQVETARKLPAG
jgi:hypothetical protein